MVPPWFDSQRPPHPYDLLRRLITRLVPKFLLGRSVIGFRAKPPNPSKIIKYVSRHDTMLRVTNYDLMPTYRLQSTHTLDINMRTLRDYICVLRA